MATQPRVIALAGNPNVGKSTLFNALTGARQHVGNWPGKTVEKKEGWTVIDGQDVMIVDLPGTYSLAAYSIEEIIARDFIVQQRPAAVVAVVDAANLERNLYLVCQLIELGVPLVVALNMTDMAQRRGMCIDPARLSAGLGGVPVVETVGTRGLGLDSLRAAIVGAAQVAGGQIPYAPLLSAAIERLAGVIAAESMLTEHCPPRWLAIKLLEGDSDLIARLEAQNRRALLAAADSARAEIEAALGDDAETLLTDQRYQYIIGVVDAAVERPAGAVDSPSDRVDTVLTHRLLGLPIFLLLMWTVFQFTANVSAPLVDWVDATITGPLARWLGAGIGAVGLGGTWIESLLIDGVLAGVGGVLVFVPVLLCLYIAIALLEDSGYMARAAFVMDRLMRAAGLHGKSFLPLLIGFGCTVPAIYATRTLENARDRALTAFLATFMSCGARLPVYVVFAAVFFGAGAGHVIFALYLLGIGAALLTALVLKRTLYHAEPPPPFVMELPPYRWPQPLAVARQTWDRTRGFVRRAFTVILACSVALWLLLAIPADLDPAHFNAVEAQESLYGSVSGALAPALAPAGFGTWQAAGSLVTGFVAKEVIIGTMNQVYGVAEPEEDADAPAPGFAEDAAAVVGGLGEALVLTGQEIVNIVPRTVNLIPFVEISEADWLNRGDEEETPSALGAALAEAFTPLAAAAFLVFVLLYMPCMTATAAMRAEFGGRLTLAQLGYTLLIAWGAAVLVYQVGSLLGLG